MPAINRTEEEKFEYKKYLQAIQDMNNAPNKLRAVFASHEWFMNIKLIMCNPCRHCDNYTEYHRGTSIECEHLDPIICEVCLKLPHWRAACMDKLRDLEYLSIVKE